MYEVSQLNKVKTFYNKFINAPKRASIDLKVELLNNTLIHTIQFGKLGLRVLVSGNNSNNFKPLVVNYDKWYNSLNSITKGTKEVEISTIDGNLSINNQNILLSFPSKSGKVDWKKLATLNSEAIDNAICINNVCNTNGKLSCNSKAFFSLEDNKLKIINTNDIILQESVIHEAEMEVEDFIFAINNDYVSNMKKWFICANKDSMNVTIYKYGSFIKFTYISYEDILYEMIVPIEYGVDITNIYNTLNTLINQKWIGIKVELDESDMYQVAVEESIAELINSGKKISKRTLKKELDEFTKNTNKIDAFKKLDTKTIDVPFLSLANSIGEKNVYILRTLYQNYISAISEFDYFVYYLNTKTKALIFGHSDEMFSFKTLFMLRKPKEIIAEISNEDLEDIEQEEFIETQEDDIFEPT